MSKIKCPNCGAIIDVHEPKCPYCGYINPTGAQEKFMKELESKREKLDNVDEEAAELYNHEIRKKGKRLLITIAATTAVIVLGVLFFALKDRIIKDPYKLTYERTPEEQINEIIWEKEYFSRFDELYEAEKYDELVELYYETLDDDSHDYWNWKHYYFLDYLVLNTFIDYNLEEYSNYVRKNSHLPFSTLLYYTSRFYYRDYAENITLTEHDIAVLDDLRERSVSVIHEKLYFTDEDMEALRPELYGSGYVDFNSCDKIAKKYFKKFTE